MQLEVLVICWAIWKSQNRAWFDRKIIKHPCKILWSQCLFDVLGRFIQIRAKGSYRRRDGHRSTGSHQDHDTAGAWHPTWSPGVLGSKLFYPGPAWTQNTKLWPMPLPRSCGYRNCWLSWAYNFIYGVITWGLSICCQILSSTLRLNILR